MLGELEEAEVACRLGLHHFQDDETLRYHLGLALTRQNRYAEAIEALGQGGELFGSAVLRGLVLLAEGRVAEARSELDRSISLDAREDREARSLVRNLRAMLRARRWLLATGVFALLIGVALMVYGVPGGVGLLGCASAGLAASWLLARRLLGQVVSPQRLARLRLLPPEGLGARGPSIDDVAN